ncbi:MAG: serine/threonine protein kinase [Pseudonocardiales bacterium]|nr:MAG: serine/threonine protein kinase [Pseudonocardiales bacterium]
MSGWKLPGYVVEELLGFGATGDVWRGRVASTGEAVALKRITVSDSQRLRSVHTEAALLATLDHPHLVRLHEIRRRADSVVLVLDLAAGGTLAELIDTRGRITPGEAITALAPIGAALAYAHNAGVVHGDVTPSNVLFTDDGMPLLADLGVARLLGDDAPAHSTPAFIDPAVAAGCVPGPQSDVFMLGAVSFQALTGGSIWPGGTPAEVLAAAATGEIGDVDAALSAVAVPEAMRAVISRALSVQPAARGSAAEFALDLRHAGVPVGVELSAGRQRAVLPVAAAAGSADTNADESARPPFDRPRGTGAQVGAPVLTHSVRPRPRPMPGRSGHRARTTRRLRAGWGAAAAGVLAVGAVAAWTAFGANHPGKAAQHAASSWPSAGPVSSATSTPASSQGAAPPTPTVAALDAKSARTTLIQLDKLRQQAFAGRNPKLLARVYAAGPLLAQDTALLNQLIPTGCRLLGVHTTYDQVQVTARGGGRVQIAVRATLAESLLVCDGTAEGRAAGSGPATLYIELAPHGAGYLIAGIKR